MSFSDKMSDRHHLIFGSNDYLGQKESYVKNGAQNGDAGPVVDDLFDMLFDYQQYQQYNEPSAITTDATTTTDATATTDATTTSDFFCEGDFTDGGSVSTKGSSVGPCIGS